MSITVNNGVANILGTPGIIQDSFVNLPAAVDVANGTIFIDTVSLNILINLNGFWTLLYASGGTANLQQVLTAGDTAIDKNIILTSSVPGSNLTYTSSDIYSCLDHNNTVIMGMRWANIYASNLNNGNTVEINFQSDSIIQTEYNNNITGLKLDFGNKIFLFGDVTGFYNDTKISVDVINQKIKFKNTAGSYNFSNIPAYANNAAALAGGLVVGDIYRSSTGGGDAMHIVH